MMGLCLEWLITNPSARKEPCSTDSKARQEVPITCFYDSDKLLSFERLLNSKNEKLSAALPGKQYQ